MYRFVRVNAGNFDISSDFWELNDQLRFILPYRELYMQDHSKGKTTSSRQMWCVWLYCDPHPHNRIYRLDEERKIQSIKHYFEEFDPLVEPFPTLIASYTQDCMSEAKRNLDAERLSLKRRAEMITSLQAKFDTMLKGQIAVLADKDMRGLVALVEKMRGDTAKIYKQYDDASRLFEEDEAKARVYGGREETLRERGELLLDIKEDYEEDYESRYVSDIND